MRQYVIEVSQIILKAGHVQPVWAGHPWVFPQGIGKIRGKLASGDEVQVLDAIGNSLGRGLYSKESAIAVRLFSSNSDECLNQDLVETRLRMAQRRRELMGLPNAGDQLTTAYRLFHGEGDGLPGLVVDKFDDVLVVQFGTFGMVKRGSMILDALQAVFQPRAILDRTTEKAAQREKFDLQPGISRGEPIDELMATERGLLFRLPLSLAQKTGFYFDQRPLRARIEELSAGKDVLDTYSYVGAIGMGAKRGGAARVCCVDSSAPALEVGRALAEENGVSVEFIKEKALNYLQAQEPIWDIVIADPPKLAQSRAGRDRAMKAFRKIAAAAVRATKSGGLVILSSCSAALGIASVERCLALGARDEARRVTVVERVFQGADHPVHPAFSEGLYLSSVIAYVE